MNISFPKFCGLYSRRTGCWGPWLMAGLNSRIALSSLCDGAIISLTSGSIATSTVWFGEGQFRLLNKLNFNCLDAMGLYIRTGTKWWFWCTGTLRDSPLYCLSLRTLFSCCILLGILRWFLCTGTCYEDRTSKWPPVNPRSSNKDRSTNFISRFLEQLYLCKKTNFVQYYQAISTIPKHLLSIIYNRSISLYLL